MTLTQMTINEARNTVKLEEDTSAAFFTEVHLLWEIALSAIEVISVIEIVSIATFRDQCVCASATGVCKPGIRLTGKTH